MIHAHNTLQNRRWYMTMPVKVLPAPCTCVRTVMPVVHMTRDMMGHMHEELKGVDILVNNAGIQYVSPVHEFPEDKWWVLLLAAVVGRYRGA